MIFLKTKTIRFSFEQFDYELCFTIKLRGMLVILKLLKYIISFYIRLDISDNKHIESIFASSAFHFSYIFKENFRHFYVSSFLCNILQYHVHTI